MGFAFPKEERDALVAAEPAVYLLPGTSDLRFNRVVARLARLDVVTMGSESATRGRCACRSSSSASGWENAPTIRRAAEDADSLGAEREGRRSAAQVSRCVPIDLSCALQGWLAPTSTVPRSMTASSRLSRSLLLGTFRPGSGPVATSPI
jgi:hypothetical protein